MDTIQYVKAPDQIQAETKTQKLPLVKVFQFKSYDPYKRRADKIISIYTRDGHHFVDDKGKKYTRDDLCKLYPQWDSWRVRGKGFPEVIKLLDDWTPGQKFEPVEMSCACCGN